MVFRSLRRARRAIAAARTAAAATLRTRQAAARASARAAARRVSEGAVRERRRAVAGLLSKSAPAGRPHAAAVPRLPLFLRPRHAHPLLRALGALRAERVCHLFYTRARSSPTSTRFPSARRGALLRGIRGASAASRPRAAPPPNWVAHARAAARCCAASARFPQRHARGQRRHRAGQPTRAPRRLLACSRASVWRAALRLWRFTVLLIMIWFPFPPTRASPSADTRTARAYNGVHAHELRADRRTVGARCHGGAPQRGARAHQAASRPWAAQSPRCGPMVPRRRAAAGARPLSSIIPARCAAAALEEHMMPRQRAAARLRALCRAEKYLCRRGWRLPHARALLWMQRLRSTRARGHEVASRRSERGSNAGVPGCLHGGWR